MAFFDSLRGLFSSGERPGAAADRLRLVEAWALDDGGPHPEFPGKVPAADPDLMAAPPRPGAYDVDQWRRKLRRVLDKLPASEAEWDPMLTEARALNLDEAWVLRSQLDEFTLLIRRIVADGLVTPQEHRKLEVARQLLGITEAEAETLVKSVVDEASAFFGKPIEGA